MKILYEDQEIIVCYKPSGVATQTAKLGSKDMVSLLKNHIYKTSEKKQEPYLAIIHRLDQPVEGLLVFAKTPYAAKELNRNLQTEQFGKYYKARLHGIPAKKKETLVDYLVKDSQSHTAFVSQKEDSRAKRAVLNYEVLEIDPQKEESVVQVQLETGRYHQIRVQMAHMGCPIVGDTKYNPHAVSQPGWQKIALCAYRLEFTHPKTKKKMVFEIEPEWN